MPPKYKSLCLNEISLCSFLNIIQISSNTKIASPYIIKLIFFLMQVWVLNLVDPKQG